MKFGAAAGAVIRRYWRWGAAAAGLAAAWWLVPAALRRMDVFRIRRVEVTGARFIEADAVARAAGFGAKANVFGDLEPARRRVLAMPGVERVEVHRRLPGAVEFEVTEFEPVALAATGGKLALVDRRGRLLPFDPTRAPIDLPISPADSAVTGLIDRLKDADADLYGAVTTAARERGAVVLETGTFRLIFRVGATTKDILGAAAVVGELARRHWTVAEIDARFDRRVIVRGRRA